MQLFRNMSNAGAPDSSIVEQLKKLLTKYGTELLKPCESTEELLRKLDRLERVLLHTLQEYKKVVEMLLQPSKEALIADELIRHSELDVRVSVASCICQIIRITAPDEPYEEDHMKEFFLLANSAFEMLPCMSGRAYSKSVSILHTMSNTQSCVMMLDLEIYATIDHMFHLFLDGIRTSHPSDVFSSMEKIMTVIIRNTVDNDEFLLVLVKILLNSLRKENQKVSPVSFQLAENTFKNCSGDLEMYRSEAITCLDVPVENYAEVIVSFFQDTTQRDNTDLKDTEDDVSCPGEAGLAIDADLCNLTEGNETPNLKNDENCNENSGMISHSLDDADKLDKSMLMQHEQKPEEIDVQRKRNRKPNSLKKAEEGYDPFWMLVDWKSLDNNTSKKNKKENCPAKTKISKDLLPEDHSEEGQGSSAKVVPVEESRRKNIVSEDLKEASSQCTPLCSKDEAPIGRESKQNPKGSLPHLRKRTACKSVGKEVVGRRIKVWWPLDKKFYKGKIVSFEDEYKLHQIDYDDGEIEFLDLKTECWKLLKDGSSSAHNQEIGAAPANSSGAK